MFDCCAFESARRCVDAATAEGTGTPVRACGVDVADRHSVGAAVAVATPRERHATPRHVPTLYATCVLCSIVRRGSGIDGVVDRGILVAGFTIHSVSRNGCTAEMCCVLTLPGACPVPREKLNPSVYSAVVESTRMVATVNECH